MVVLETAFEYDRDKYGIDLETLGKKAQYTVPVVVQRARIMRTRAKFDCPWKCMFEVDVEDDMVDKDQLLEWLYIAGRQIGIGDWRPQTSGNFGRFAVEHIEQVSE